MAWDGPRNEKSQGAPSAGEAWELVGEYPSFLASSGTVWWYFLHSLSEGVLQD